MAFRQPQPRPTQQRQVSFTAPVRPDLAALPQQQRLIDDSQEWVLFSPVQAPSITRTQTASTEQTPRTAGLSRLSDYGSLDTVVKSEEVGDDENQTEHGSAEYEDGEELDSLDDGLHAFRETSLRGGSLRKPGESGQTVLPAHDGLGTFEASSAPVQEQLWQFERYNPRRRRRQSSIQQRLDAIEHTAEETEVEQRRQRIEKWRIEQSRAVLDEIERETRRRRRMSIISTRRPSVDIMEEDTASLSRIAPRISTANQQEHSEETIPDTESFWQRFTRRVIRDLIGLDEDLLSVIFGEALPDDAAQPAAGSSNAPQGHVHQRTSSLSATTYHELAWQQRLVQRLSKELGILVHQLTEHPGAFSTYRGVEETPSDVGVPAYMAKTSMPALPTLKPHKRRDSVLSPTGPGFAPTLAQYHCQPDAAPASWNPNGQRDTSSSSYQGLETTADVAANDHLRREREYWERDLDVNAVFGFLRNRFSSRSPSPTHADPSSHPVSLFPAHPSSTATNTFPAGTTTTPMTSCARRAAIIQHHHPLISRAEAARSQQQHVSSTGNANAAGVRRSTVQQQRLKRMGSSSCASQSTKKTKSASSRNYWDIGGSVAGSAVRPVSAGGAGVGPWGGV